MSDNIEQFVANVDANFWPLASIVLVAALFIWVRFFLSPMKKPSDKDSEEHPHG